MATTSDVENALGSAIAAALYPNGIGSPSAVGSAVRIVAGWPDPATLDKDMVETGGVPTAAQVSIYPLPAERVTTRYRDEWRQNPLPAATYGMSVSGQAITITGAAPAPHAPQNLAVIVNGAPYNVQTTAGQTAAQVAQALRNVIAVDFAGATVSGAVITLPTGARALRPAVGVLGTAYRPLRTVEKQFQVSVYHSNPAGRALVADMVDTALAATFWLTYADGTSGQLKYHGSREDDFVQKQRIYRRLLIYTAEFTVIQTQQAAQIVVQTTNLRDADGALIKSVSI